MKQTQKTKTKGHYTEIISLRKVVVENTAFVGTTLTYTL